MSVKVLYFDLETTGVKFWRNGIHQIAGILEVNGEVVEEFDLRVCPFGRAEIEDSALQVAGVTREQIMQYAPMREVYLYFTELLSKHCNKYNKTDKIYLCGYNNASFDNPFLRAWFVQNGDNYFGSWFWSAPLDVMILAADYLRGLRAEMEDFKLKTVAKKLGIEVEESKLHDALYDIRITKQIYDKIKLDQLANPKKL